MAFASELRWYSYFCVHMIHHSKVYRWTRRELNVNCPTHIMRLIWTSTRNHAQCQMCAGGTASTHLYVAEISRTKPHDKKRRNRIEVYVLRTTGIKRSRGRAFFCHCLSDPDTWFPSYDHLLCQHSQTELLFVFFKYDFTPSLVYFPSVILLCVIWYSVLIWLWFRNVFSHAILSFPVVV